MEIWHIVIFWIFLIHTHIYKLDNVYIYIHMLFLMLLFKSMNVGSWCTAQVGTRLFFEEVNSCCQSPRDPSVKRHALLLWCGGSDFYKPVQVVIPVIPRIGYLGSPLKGGKKHQFFELLKKLSWNWLRPFSLREQSSAKSITHGFTERAKELLPAYQPHFGIGMWEVPYLIWIICTNHSYVSWWDALHLPTTPILFHLMLGIPETLEILS